MSDVAPLPPSFLGGEADAEGALAPPIETMGARYGVSVAQPGEGFHGELSEPYLLPSVQWRNGSTEAADPSIVQTPLGGMMPGPFAIAPAIVVAPDWSEQAELEGDPFHDGIADSYPEGSPVPSRHN